MDPLLPVFRRLAPGEGQTLRVLNDYVTVKAEATDTGGAYALLEVHSPPGNGMPRHLHRYDDKAYFVMEGAYAFEVGEQTFELGQGGHIFVPRETSHSYRSVGQNGGRLLILVSPGGIFEQFLLQIGVPVTGQEVLTGPVGPTEIARIAMVAEKYGIEIIPSPAIETG